MLKELVIKNRSYRRFIEEERIEYGTLIDLVGLARNTPSTVNSQALKYILVNNEPECDKVFDTLAWAGMLKNWNGPEKGERPSAYIVILCDLSLGKNKHLDVGIAAQTIMLGATEMKLGGCMLGSINREQLSKELDINLNDYSIELVLALGKPKEKVTLVDVDESGSTAYYRDENMVHYVPKRSVQDLIIK